MASTPSECPVPTCSTGPCRTAAPLILAESAEVPVGCPNRIEFSDPATQLPRLLSSTDLYTTPRAAALISVRPGGGRRSLLLGSVSGGRLVLLEPRVQRPIRGGSLSQPSPRDTPVTPITPTPDEEQDWIEIVLKKRDGSPAVGEAYEIHLTDGSTRRGDFDASGKVRFENIPAGTCVVGFPELDQAPGAGSGSAAPPDAG